MIPLTEDEKRTEAEVAPDEKPRPREPKTKTYPPDWGIKKLAEKRLNIGYVLAKIVLFGIFGIYAVASVAMLINGDSDEVLTFSLEIVRLLIPPLTFVLGFLFGSKQNS